MSSIYTSNNKPNDFDSIKDRVQTLLNEKCYGDDQALENLNLMLNKNGDVLDEQIENLFFDGDRDNELSEKESCGVIFVKDYDDDKNVSAHFAALLVDGEMLTPLTISPDVYLDVMEDYCEFDFLPDDLSDVGTVSINLPDEKQDRTISSINMTIPAAGDDSEETTVEFAAHLEGVLKENFGIDDVTVTYTGSNVGQTVIELEELDDVEKEDEECFKDVDDCIKSFEEEIDDLYDTELSNFEEVEEVQGLTR
jgi:hypothetical protein